MKKKSIRLSKSVFPTEYNIKLKPDLKNFTFEGIETITLSVIKATKILTLHSKELEIDTVRIGEVFGRISYNEKNETATFAFPKTIPAGKIKLSLVFKGILNDKMRGFYRSRYHIKGKEHHLATTQFEATDARRAFPCFDEPAHKAVFHVSLIVPKGKSAISNTLPVSVMEHEAGYEIVKFAPTPKMSTYLLAFIVGDFEYVEKKSNRGVIVRVHTTHGKKHQAKFALDVTVRVLEFYEKYFNIPYPLHTLDMIAIPDFSSLAMENWGAITFREVGLLVDEKHTSTGSKELIAEVIAHELAHQWFGNLVTMEWWTHLWLNEGFASYIPYLVIDKLFPKWNIWERFTTDTHGIALRLDALKTTHPIEVEVHHPDEIGEIFDAVSYSKGASVIRMLADYLGEKDFRDGLRYYLKKHSYKNTETIHLWQAFEKVSGKSVAHMMHNWTGKSGYPLIRAQIDKNKLVLSQSRFFSSPISKARAKDKTVWQIPILVKFPNSLQAYFLESLSQHDGARSSLAQQRQIDCFIKSMPKKNFGKSFGKKFDFKNFWLKINFGETGFFRTAYSKELLEKLKMPIEKKILPSWDRLGIIRDLFALAEAGIVPTTDALEFLSVYKNEDNYAVWVEIATGLGRLEQILARENSKNNLNKFILDLFSPIMKTLSWEKKSSEPYTDALLRSLVISRLGRSGDKKIIAQVKKKFMVMQKQHTHPDIRAVIYALVAFSGNMKEYKMLVKRYKEENLHEEKNRIGNALGYFKDKKILELVCTFAISKDVRIQDTVSILSSVGANPLGRDIWWSFITKNWKTMVSRYGEGGLTLGRAVTAIS
ncbi:MAG TPA: M1 family metallopeptidase, partial [Candidatus Paceibacterota bacterium]|nr:M1 family metallopeptidase [Candidatus Paceibacterota bacterium]